MKKWKRRNVDDDDEDDDEDEEEEHRYVRPRRSFSSLTYLYDDEDEEEGGDERWNELEKKIRAGKYKPRRSDPWTLHVLYNNLKELNRER